MFEIMKRLGSVFRFGSHVIIGIGFIIGMVIESNSRCGISFDYVLAGILIYLLIAVAIEVVYKTIAWICRGANSSEKKTKLSIYIGQLSFIKYYCESLFERCDLILKDLKDEDLLEESQKNKAALLSCMSNIHDELVEEYDKIVKIIEEM
ncbi:MAG: hypothetical protein JSS09_02825 [Verrucomicrobia bacterium]|nr:hypothetical protein [Verrucomicrobiota bacterium]